MAVQMKSYSEAQPGEALGPLEILITPEMAKWWGDGSGDRNPWFTKSSASGRPVVSPTIFHALAYRLRTHAYPGKLENPTLHIQYEVETFKPVKVGEKITAKGKIVDKYIKRGRPYLAALYEFFDEKGDLVARYNYVTLLRYKREGQ
ncbi:MAG: MaoC family dehydratase N-terminal domain-containing protein [Chloroflexi bacterium]|nr:MaoC family dehydratase N-terminal domain-containing protein [Chloroflexota bacterium]